MFLQTCVDFCCTLWLLLCSWVLAGVRACVPIAWLPRKSVKGKIVLITGSGSGIGRLMAIEFHKLGAQLVLWDIDEKMNAVTKEALDQSGGAEAHAYTVDMGDREQIYAAAERVKREVGSPHIVINNAGILSGKKLLDCPDVLIEKTLAVNCAALFFTTKAFLPAMLARNEGHLVTISSMAGISGVSGLVDYCASKHGANGFNEALRSELRQMGAPIRVTTVCPYFINTAMTEGRIQSQCPLLFPFLEPDHVVARIVDAVLTDTDELFMPWAANLAVALKGFQPARVNCIVTDYFGFSRAVDIHKDHSGRKTG